MEKLQSIEQFSQLKSQENLIFMFSADWCPDCRFLDPVLPEIEAENKEFTFIYVDRDEFIDVCVEQNVFGIPSFIAFNKGQETGRFVSKDRKTKEQIQEFIKGLK